MQLCTWFSVPSHKTTRKQKHTCFPCEPALLLCEFRINLQEQKCVCNIVSILKRQTTYYLWARYKDYLSTHFWEKHIFWSDGYFACSIGEVSTATIQKYIKSQGWCERIKGVLLPPAKASGFPHPDNVMKAVKGTTSIALRKKFSHWS